MFSLRTKLGVAMAVSLAVHVATGALLRASVSTPDAPEDDVAITVEFDLVEAPEAPEAEALGADEGDEADEADGEAEGDDAEAETEADEAEEAAAVATIEEPTDPLETRLTADAGVPEDAAAVAETTADAGVPEDATAIAETTADAGVPDDEVASAPPRDAGADPRDGGAAVASAGGGAGGDPAADGDAGASDEAFPGTGADLIAYLPEGDIVTVLLRLDRIRGTKWAELTDQIIAPMPDYQSIIGGRDKVLADVFDTVVISTPSPRDVDQTTLVAKSHLSDAKLRTFFDHPGQPVTWEAARGGVRGVRGPGKLVYPGDPRVFLMPFHRWVVLAHPKHLGDAAEKAGAGAARATLPAWLRDVRTIEDESGDDVGPVTIVTITDLEPSYELPANLGTLPGPDRLTATLEVTDLGFLIRGNAAFATPADARAFVTEATRVRELMLSALGRVLLTRTHTLDAVKGLTLRQSGSRVAYATSMSESDGRALLEYAAEQTEAYFGSRRRPPRKRSPK